MRPRVVLPFALLAACSGDPAPSQPDASTDLGAPPDVSTDVPTVDDVPEPVDAGPPPPPPSEPGRHTVTVTDTRQMIPGAGLPMETVAGNSNNNLDVIRHAGRVYLAWRTAPDHFASSETQMFIISSADERAWRFEARLAIDTDIREPRFLEIGDRLFLYVSRLGSNPLGFEPQGVSVTELRSDGAWSPLENVYRDGFLAWRSRFVRGRAYILGYMGGANIYLFNGRPLDVEFLTTADGRDWQPVDPARRSVYHGGGSESDFALGDDGTLYAVIRNEAGDATGWGSKVCRAPAGDLASWSCRSDPRKYDSPLMFWYDGEAYLVGRRNVTATGDYDLMQREFGPQRQTVNYQLAYRNQPKRCSLWRYVQGEDRIAFITDLPSRGDTCFASVIDGAAPNERVLYNYSSPVDGPDIPWWQGQQGETRIYRHVLRFDPR